MTGVAGEVPSVQNPNGICMKPSSAMPSRGTKKGFAAGPSGRGKGPGIVTDNNPLKPYLSCISPVTTCSSYIYEDAPRYQVTPFQKILQPTQCYRVHGGRMRPRPSR